MRVIKNKENIDDKERVGFVLNYDPLHSVTLGDSSELCERFNQAFDQQSEQGIAVLRTLKVESVQKSSTVLSKESRDRPDRWSSLSDSIISPDILSGFTDCKKKKRRKGRK